MNKLQWSVVYRIKNFLGIQPTFEPQQRKFIRRILEGKNMLDIKMFLVKWVTSGWHTFWIVFRFEVSNLSPHCVAHGEEQKQKRSASSILVTSNMYIYIY